MAQAKRTLVTLLLDRSSSMSSIHSQTVSAYNEYVDSLRTSKAPIEFTFLQFDSQSLDKLCVAEPIKNVKTMSHNDFQPRGSTPLIDSAYDTIKAVEKQEKAKGARIVICIQTDGEENCSNKHSWEELKTLIGEKTKAGWQFNFMGAGIDAYTQSAKMGLVAAQTVSYGKDHASTRAAFAAHAHNTASFAMGESATTNYSDVQKFASGDKFFAPNAPVYQPVAVTGTAPLHSHSLDLDENKDSDLSL